MLAVASSKPEHYVQQILEYFKIAEFFDEVVGATMDEKRTSKTEVLEEVLRRLELHEQKEEILMVGDTELDIRGAKDHGIECVAVTYGYGDLEKMKAEKPLKIVDSVTELETFLVSIAHRQQ
jgi:phosphoglycolate phosphatase